MFFYKLSNGTQTSNLHFQLFSPVNSREDYLVVKDAGCKKRKRKEKKEKTRRLWQVIPESTDDSKWVGMNEAGWESYKATSEARLRRHLMVTFSIRQGCGSGVVINHHGNQQRPSKLRRERWLQFRDTKG